MCQDYTFHGMTTEISYNDWGVISPGREGVGYNCLQNVYNLEKVGIRQTLMSCSVGDEVLYNDASLTSDPSLLNDSEVKKQWLDFTHTVKTRPKAPERMKNEKAPYNPLVGDEMNNEKADSEQELIINHVDAASLKEKFKKILIKDSNTTKESYIVRSLYFDFI